MSSAVVVTGALRVNSLTVNHCKDLLFFKLGPGLFFMILRNKRIQQFSDHTSNNIQTIVATLPLASEIKVPIPLK